MKLIIAEKPSVAAAYVAALGVNEKKDGYLEGNSLIVTWCIGHLVSLAEAGAYEERYKKWNYEDLPILPKERKHLVASGKEKQFSVLKSLMERTDVTEIVNGCAAGRKGLGTPATRASIIEKLVSSGFAERKGKNLIPTKDGINLVTVLPDMLASPKLTADCESKLSQMAKGELTATDFMNGYECQLFHILNYHRRLIYRLYFTVGGADIEKARPLISKVGLLSTV